MGIALLCLLYLSVDIQQHTTNKYQKYKSVELGDQQRQVVSRLVLDVVIVQQVALQVACMKHEIMSTLLSTPLISKLGGENDTTLDDNYITMFLIRSLLNIIQIIL